jgi:hypothetical protein
MPFIEGHRGCVICGNCLTLGYAEVCNARAGSAPEGFFCTLCREDGDDRTELGRAEEQGWRSPLHEEAAICERCINQAADAIVNDPDYTWKKPV